MGITGTKPPGSNLRHDRHDTRVAALTISPSWLHVYWRISTQDLADIQGMLAESPGGARPVLRFYDVTCILFDGTNAHQIFDVEVDLRTETWDVPIWSADKSYVIDLGCKTSGARFHPIARSNVVAVPRAGPSQRVAESYLRVEDGQIRSLLPVPLADLPPRPSAWGPRAQIVAAERQAGEEQSFERDADQAQITASAPPKDEAEEAGRYPGRVPNTAVGGGAPPPLRGRAYPFDLVEQTEETFSRGLSSRLGGTPS